MGYPSYLSVREYRMNDSIPSSSDQVLKNGPCEILGTCAPPCPTPPRHASLRLSHVVIIIIIIIIIISSSSSNIITRQRRSDVIVDVCLSVVRSFCLFVSRITAKVISRFA